MAKVLSPERRMGVFAAGLGFAVAAMLLTNLIPPVVGLGDKVRLPIFHGGATWVNMTLFGFMGLLSLGYLLLRTRDLYRWAAGFRVVAAVLWIANTALGVIAAMDTWDFSASKSSPFLVIREDPRLMAQFQTLALLLVILIVGRMLESDWWRAAFDVVFAGAFGWIMYSVLTSPAARALHPDNPVLNSESDIQVPFFAIVGCVFVASVLFAWLVRDRILRAD